MTTIKDAPGCIGSAVIRSSSHPVCQACNFKTACEKLARMNAELIAGELGSQSIKIDEKPKAMQPKKPVKVKTASAVSPKVKDLADKIKNSGVSTISDIYKVGIEELTAVADEIQTGIKTRHQIRDAISTKLGLNRMLAQSKSSIVVGAMILSNIIEETDDGLEQKRAA